MMESRGSNDERHGKGRLAIARRSCDQCRARKVGCDRGSPCSSCTSARLNCTHSAVASNSNAPKQRVLISAQYEQKIDGIAKDIDGIKNLLQRFNTHPAEAQNEVGAPVQLSEPISLKTFDERQTSSTCRNDLICDSAHIIDFLKVIVNDRGSRVIDSKAGEVLSSLEKLVKTLEDPVSVRDLSKRDIIIADSHGKSSLPPLEAAVAVLRWAKDHTSNTRIAWISQILPLERFTEICQKVYFAVNDYSQVDFILANGYLSYIFFEHVVVSGRQDYSEHCRLCRRNIHNALLQLPLLLPASMEMIAALALGAFNGIENSNATVAWSFISVASDLCQRLGYHRLRLANGNESDRQAAEERLFWAVHRMDKGLSVRLGRPSNIRDSEITLAVNADEPRFTRLARIQGVVYDQLYSPVGLSRSVEERGRIAGPLAEELRGIINETKIEILGNTSGQSDDYAIDPMRIIYLQSDLICQSSLLCLILRAIPTENGAVSEDCVAVAREVMEIHEKCMTNVRGYNNDPLMVTRYINWAILHCPFVPFSVLFTHAVQNLDAIELERLDRFAASLEPDTTSSESLAHPYRLYKLLCQAARLYFETASASSSVDPSWNSSILASSEDYDLINFGTGAGITANGALEMDGTQACDLESWYYGNQQMMTLLDENALFDSV